MTPLHETLRATTRALHERTEAAFARFDLMSRAGYGEFLQAQAAALLPLEAALDDHAAALMEDWPARQRANALKADLAALGLALPPLLSPPTFANDDQALGALYVIEGSKLGARYLLERVIAHQPDLAEAAAFLSHRDGKGAWPAFLAKLAAAPAREADVLIGATSAFALFERAALQFEKA